MTLRDGYELTEAQEPDIPSLTTIHHRTFHINNAFHEKALPDTPTMKAWWKKVFEDSIADPEHHVLVIKPSPNDDNKVIGTLCSKLVGPSEKGSGLWTSNPLTEDHDKVLCSSFINPMSKIREEMMTGRSHYLIELLAVDNDYHSIGAGTALLHRCCQIADEEAVEVFVMANGPAMSFYRRHGFEVGRDIVLPGEHKYREVLMVRRPACSGTS